MATTTSTVFNIYTNGHGSHDRSWNDYIDYSDDRGIVFDSLDYDLPTHSRSQITECKYMDAEQTEKVRKAVIAKLVESGKVFEPRMWIGGSCYTYIGMPCKVVRSPKYRGDATFISLVSKRDHYNREIYKALIVGSDHLKYYVSPSCIKIDPQTVIPVLQKMTLKNLAYILDNDHFGHWNFHPYNHHLFGYLELLSKHYQTDRIALGSLKWWWQVKDNDNVA